MGRFNTRCGMRINDARVGWRSHSVDGEHMSEGLSVIETMLRERRSELLEGWIAAQLAVPGVRTDLLSTEELRVESDRFLTALADAVGAGSASPDLSGAQWSPVKELLGDLSRTRATRG